MHLKGNNVQCLLLSRNIPLLRRCYLLFKILAQSQLSVAASHNYNPVWCFNLLTPPWFPLAWCFVIYAPLLRGENPLILLSRIFSCELAWLPSWGVRAERKSSGHQSTLFDGLFSKLIVWLLDVQTSWRETLSLVSSHLTPAYLRVLNIQSVGFDVQLMFNMYSLDIFLGNFFYSDYHSI